jgi:pimeloyl-ACP methyl ester carboxylesterase
MYFRTDNGNLWYTDTVKGSAAILLLHGYLESSEIWNGFAEKLSRSFRVIAADLPGHGRSEFTGDVHTMEMMADTIASLVASIKVDKVFMIGHSLGGYVTLAFLERHPVYLSGYCLFHSHPFPDIPETAEKRRRDIELVSDGLKDSIIADSVKKMYATVNLDKFGYAVERSVKIGSQIKAEGIVKVLKGMILRPSRVNLMEEGRKPCLWILGALDNFIAHDTILTRINLASNTTVKTLPASGHMGFIEEEDLAVSIVSEFVRGIAVYF